MAAPPSPSEAAWASNPTRLRWEIGIVLTATLGLSALSSIITLVRRSLAETPIGQQTTQLNPTRDAEPWWDVISSLLNITSSLALVALVVYLLWEPGVNALRRIGLDFTQFRSDLARAAVVGLIIGVPGLGVYLAGRAIGATVHLAASPNDLTWWTVPVLILAAVRAGLLEEVIMLGWLFDRFRRLGVNLVVTICISAIIRGAYHAYQGWPAIAGNIAMGLVFGWAYHRWGRVMPLVIAHTLIDIVAFIGYPFALQWWPALFGASPA